MKILVLSEVKCHDVTAWEHQRSCDLMKGECSGRPHREHWKGFDAGEGLKAFEKNTPQQCLGHHLLGTGLGSRLLQVRSIFDKDSPENIEVIPVRRRCHLNLVLPRHNTRQ